MEIAQAHLQWIKNHPNFVPSDGNVVDNSVSGGGRVISHYDTMSSLYNMNPNSHKLAEVWFRDDVRYHNSLALRIHQYEAEFLKEMPRCYFATIGFADKSDIKTLHNIVQTILSFDWLVKCLAVLEFNTDKGLHPHLHMYIHCNLPKSKVIEKLFATKGLKKVCSGKNFIDCKQGLPYHKDYVLGNKQESKEELVKADKLLREQFSIPHLYEK